MNAYLKVENVDVAIVEEYQFRDKKVCELRRIISLGWAACGYIWFKSDIHITMNRNIFNVFFQRFRRP